MIVIDGVPFSANSSSTSSGKDTLLALLENPFLIFASSSLKATQERRFSLSGESGAVKSKWVYVFQREYATVDPAHADFVGTDEATTCVGLVIRNRRNGMTSLAHMDSPNIIDMGLSQMLSLLIDHSLDTELDVHLIGSFEDFSQKVCPGVLMVALYHKAMKIWMDIPFLCVQKLSKLYGQERKIFIFKQCVFLATIPKGILMEMRTPF